MNGEMSDSDVAHGLDVELIAKASSPSGKSSDYVPYGRCEEKEKQKAKIK